MSTEIPDSEMNLARGSWREQDERRLLQQYNRFAIHEFSGLQEHGLQYLETQFQQALEEFLRKSREGGVPT